MAGLVCTKRFLGQVVTGHGIGPGSAATADIDVFTAATVVFVAFEVAQFQKKF